MRSLRPQSWLAVRGVDSPSEAEAAERSEASPYTSPGASPTASPEASPTSQGTNPSTKRKAAASLLKAAKNGSLAKSLDTFEEAQVEDGGKGGAGGQGWREGLEDWHGVQHLRRCAPSLHTPCPFASLPGRAGRERERAGRGARFPQFQVQMTRTLRQTI